MVLVLVLSFQIVCSQVHELDVYSQLEKFKVFIIIILYLLGGVPLFENLNLDFPRGSLTS